MTTSMAQSVKTATPKTLKHVPKSRKQRKKDKELKTLREQATHILPASSFKRVVNDLSPCTLVRYSKEAIQALQTATENEITKVFEGAAFCAEMGKRDTVTVEDMKNYMALRRSMIYKKNY